MRKIGNFSIESKQDMNKTILIVLSGLFLWCGQSLAQTQFTAKANRTTVGKHDEFTLTFSINAEGSQFKGPANLSRDFYILGGPNQSSSTTIVNGNFSQTRSYSYSLRPRKEGTFTIGAASIRSKGKTYKTKPIKIKVTAQAQRSKNPNDPQNVAAENIFLRAFINKRKPYQGEPIVVTYKLFFNLNISGIEFAEEPDFNGFYKHNIELPDRPNISKESYKGKTFSVATVKQMVLIPQKYGTPELEPLQMRVQAAVPTKRRDFFGMPMTKNVNYMAVSPALKLEVKALPLAGKPADFSGAVGDYSFNVDISKTEIEANESVSIKLKIRGKGNMKLFDLPELNVPTAIEAYDPKYGENITINAGGMKGNKSNEYLLIPRYKGTYKIPPIEFNYFDPVKEQYRTLSSAELLIRVSGGEALPEGGGTQGVTSSGKEQVDFIGKDILFIKTGTPVFSKKGRHFVGSALFYILLALPFLLLALLLVVRKRLQARNADTALVRNRKAGKVARKHLANAQKSLSGGDEALFYEELAKAIWGYLSDKLSIEQADLNKEKVSEVLKAKGIDEALIRQLLATLDHCEFARFAPGSGAAKMQDDYSQTETLISTIENKL